MTATIRNRTLPSQRRQCLGSSLELNSTFLATSELCYTAAISYADGMSCHNSTNTPILLLG